jgi:hydroxypyruvate isomerase
MPRFAANLSLMYTEWSFLDRFQAAAEDGFDAVEFLFPYEHPPEDIARRLADNTLEQALFNLPPGDWAAGERGFASIPGREDEFRASVERALPYIQATGVRRVHVMAGIHDPDDEAARETYAANLRVAAERLQPFGVDVLVEPINGRDMPGYFMSDFEFAADLIDALAIPNLRLQFDIYHRQIMHGDVTIGLRTLMPLTAHIQIASVPSRNEPADEELSFPYLFDELDRLGYAGFVGCEYRPKAGTRDGLAWFAPWRRR